MIERERAVGEREKFMGERNMDWPCPYMPKPGMNLQPFGAQDDAQPTKPPSQGNLHNFIKWCHLKKFSKRKNHAD